MALSFSLNPEFPPATDNAGLVPVLVTGAKGNIGAYFAEHAGHDLKLRLGVRKIDDDARKLERFGELVEMDLDNLEGLKKVCKGIDTVVHLAGEASPEATWDSLLSANVVGSYNMMVAAKAAGCRRLIYASSIHAISGYPSDVQVKSTDPVNPGDLYGVSKCFAEALGRYMAEREQLSVICIRIGAFQPDSTALAPEGSKMLDAWVSQRDLTHLIECCIHDSHLRYAIFNGLSDNRFKRMDISDARELVGYRPKDDLTDVNPDLADVDLKDKPAPPETGEPIDQEKSGLREDL